MRNELKRAIVNPWNLLIVLLVVFLMFMNAYIGGWKTGFNAMSSSDILNLEDKLFFTKLYGNTLKVWLDSHSTIATFAPILLLVPYLLSYREEIDSGFRTYMLVRIGKKRYLINKLLAIAISGTVILVSAELIFYFFSGVASYTTIEPEIIGELVSYKPALFVKSPFTYFAFLLGLRWLYYFSLVVFSVGITSVLKSKIAILVTPFLVIALLDLLLPSPLAPNVIMSPQYNEGFSLSLYAVFIIGLLGIGILSYVINEKRMSA